jgi:hypothetical protein
MRGERAPNLMGNFDQTFDMQEMPIDQGFPLPRRFPPPWSVEETEACFIVRDGKTGTL